MYDGRWPLQLPFLSRASYHEHEGLQEHVLLRVEPSYRAGNETDD